MNVTIFNSLKATNLRVNISYRMYPSEVNEHYVPSATIKNKSNYFVDLGVEKVYELTVELINGRNSLVKFRHKYQRWDKNISIMWLRPGNYGGDTVNWISPGSTQDCWHYGGELKGPEYTQHRQNCGNIDPSRGSADFGEEAARKAQEEAARKEKAEKEKEEQIRKEKETIARTDAERREAINSYLRSVMVTDSTIQDYIDRENRDQVLNNNYRVVYENVNVRNPTTEYLLNPSSLNIYPGAILVVDNNLDTLTPTLLNLPRGEVSLVTDLPKRSNGDTECIVKADKYGNLTAPVNDAISRMVEKFKESGLPLKSQLIDITEEASSSEELRLKVGASANVSGIVAAADFESQSKNYNKYFFTNYSQIFYTVKAEYNRYDMSELFAPEVTVNDIKRVTGGKPLIFVTSVNYGRMFHITENISSSVKEMVDSASVSYSGVTVNSDHSQKNTNFKYKQTISIKGGNAKTANQLFSEIECAEQKEKVQTEADSKSKLSKDLSMSELDFQRALQYSSEIRKLVRKFKAAYMSETIGGTQTAEVDGVVLSYQAITLAGQNPKAAVFLNSGLHKVKKLIPNSNLKFTLFNTLKATNLFVTVSYDIVDPRTGTVINTVTACKDAKVANKSPLGAVTQLPPNVANVRVTLVNGRNSNVKFSSNSQYANPCSDISIGWLRPGKIPVDTVDWFWDNETWHNGGE